MIVYGHNSTQIGVENLPHEKCDNCESEGTLSIHTYSSYAHVFWIPLFPYNKYGVAHCSNCNATFEKKQMNEGLKRKYSNVKQLFRAPFWHFSGLIIIAIIISAVFINGKVKESHEIEYIGAPNVGDVYSTEIDNAYSLMKVFYVQDSLVGVIGNEYAINLKSEVDELYENDFTDTVYFTQAELEGLYNDGTIYEIKRNEMK